MRNAFAAALLGMTAFLSTAVAAEPDSRRLVELPPPMQEHMLSNMRDHLRALDEVLAYLAAGKVKEAGELAESRIGMSSLGSHGASHLAKYMPPEMQAIGSALHKASSRFALAAQDAELDGTALGQRKVFSALQEITTACNACHAGFRLR